VFACPLSDCWCPPRSAGSGTTIEKVVLDVSGEHYVDHEAQVIGWFMKD